ncbi:MAG: DUF547 domain-containing protein [Geobacteraceae bacterium]|nr:DUF547 domain-containing protein [Geobacteraceae bacterium]
MKRIWLIVLTIVASLPVIASGADFNYSNYEALLKRHIKSGVSINSIRLNALDYSSIAEEAKQPGSDYSILIKELAAFDPVTLKSREEKIAFWVNVYNIGAIKTIIDHYPVDSIRSKRINWLGQPWGRKALSVGGKEYSLAEIENDILLDGFKDLRIHFGINCASVSCADLLAVPYRAATLFAQLEDQGRKLLMDRKKGFVAVSEKKTIRLSQIFKFDKKRFDASGGALAFISPYLSKADRTAIEAGGLKLEYLEYDWKLNDAKYAR